jgi:hypothetical protein
VKRRAIQIKEKFEVVTFDSSSFLSEFNNFLTDQSNENKEGSSRTNHLLFAANPFVHQVLKENSPLSQLQVKPSYGNILLESLDQDFDESLISNFKDLVKVNDQTELDESLLDPTELKVDRKIK